MDIGRICHLPNVINAHFDKENPMTFIKNRAVHLVAAAVVLATSTTFADAKTEVPTHSMACANNYTQTTHDCPNNQNAHAQMNHANMNHTEMATDTQNAPHHTHAYLAMMDRLGAQM